MEFQKRNEAIKAIIFDIDNTLYTDSAYARHQQDVLIGRLAKEKGLEFHFMETMVRAKQKELANQNHGKTPSLGNTFLQFGISIAESVRWREEEIKPEEFLTENQFLVSVLSELKNHFRLLCLTNNPSKTGYRTLQQLGIDEFFETVIGLDHTLNSKPHPITFQKVLDYLQIEPKFCLSVGDRIPIDIEPAKDLGMSTLLVDTVDDLGELPGLLGIN